MSPKEYVRCRCADWQPAIARARTEEHRLTFTDTLTAHIMKANSARDKYRNAIARAKQAKNNHLPNQPPEYVHHALIMYNKPPFSIMPGKWGPYIVRCTWYLASQLNLSPSKLTKSLMSTNRSEKMTARQTARTTSSPCSIPSEKPLGTCTILGAERRRLLCPE